MSAALQICMTMRGKQFNGTGLFWQTLNSFIYMIKSYLNLKNNLRVTPSIFYPRPHKVLVHVMRPQEYTEKRCNKF